jgi:hypothetical protein
VSDVPRKDSIEDVDRRPTFSQRDLPAHGTNVNLGGVVNMLRPCRNTRRCIAIYFVESGIAQNGRVVRGVGDVDGSAAGWHADVPELQQTSVVMRAQASDVIYLLNWTA